MALTLARALSITSLLLITGFAYPDSKWESLFDGKSLGPWKKTDFPAGGDARVEPKFKDEGPAIIVEAGSTLSGINWKGDGGRKAEDGQEKPESDKQSEAAVKELPTQNYEIELEAMKIKGNDFFLGLTFPVGKTHASLIVGGWGGQLIGISSIDGLDASENSTTRQQEFKKDQWYKVRLKVTPGKLEAWLDDKQIVNVEVEEKKVSLRIGDIKMSTPLGLSTFATTAAYRNIRLRRLPEAKQDGRSDNPTGHL